MPFIYIYIYAYIDPSGTTPGLIGSPMAVPDRLCLGYHTTSAENYTNSPDPQHQDQHHPHGDLSLRPPAAPAQFQGQLLTLGLSSVDTWPCALRGSDPVCGWKTRRVFVVFNNPVWAPVVPPQVRHSDLLNPPQTPEKEGTGAQTGTQTPHGTVG